MKDGSDNPSGFWARLNGGRRRFAWKEPKAFCRLKAQAAWRSINTPLLRGLAIAFPFLAFLILWAGSRIADEPFNPALAAEQALMVPLFFALGLWLITLLPERYSVWEFAINWTGGVNGTRRWTDLRGFAFELRPDYAVLILLPKPRKHAFLAAPLANPLFLGVPLSVPLDELKAFLRSRGLSEEAVDAPAAFAQLGPGSKA